MQSFIVLGIVPGTNYQLTFTFWLAVSTGLCALLCLPTFITLMRQLHRYLNIRRIAHIIDRLEVVTL